MSGMLIGDALAAKGHEVLHRTIVKDDVQAIQEALERGLEEAEAVIISGGTGIGRRDVTVEAVTPYLEKEMKGFGEVFRSLSFREIGSSAIMSRATAGVKDGRIIIVLPGSPGAAELAMRELILPELAHMVSEASR